MMWKKLRSLTFDNDDQDLQEEGVATSGRASEEQSTAEAKSDKSTICHFLRLPTEIRLQIYAYSDIAGHTIEVLNLPIIQTSRATQCYRTYSTNPIDHELVYRLESKDDNHYGKKPQPKPTRNWGYSGPAICVMPRSGRTSPSELSSSSEPTKRKRCFSVHGLFSLTSVCRQTRADTQSLIYEVNTFAFSDGNYNYSSAIRAFTQSLTEREVSVIHTIYWPLMNVLVYRRSLHGVSLEEPDRACVEELRALKGLKRVVLRYCGSEFNNIADKHSEYEKMELEGLLAEKGGWDYAVKRQFQRTLAVRGMKALIGREDVEVECEKTWRANF
ncbi:hypothetical protein BU25DRAFT_487943 [Macroventuria anomochaeta]|uniref:Uncharacterized protein n=1 Tax=Macroventuria anomochaeta TaxID=301207 RepID=A0ACB6SH84_9PLEO|nr:uncharacterized protein BU25DRAFT_487943 [Macroventuria anomochaeta]KAF2632452.1 hypothetical protein BU25DRAFT_487943 [Macroventuria anomochaeta]